MEHSDTEIESATNPNRKFKCTYTGCSAAFTRNDKLVKHVRRHTGERPFACDVEGCDKTYTNSSHLRRHKKVSHENHQTQTITCEHEGCGMVLSNKCNLKKHYLRMHNPNEFRFKCGECNQGFHRKKLLQQHVYVHTGEAGFSCDLCDLKFTTSYKLNKHKRSHRTYTCETCGETFHRWSLLLAHKRQQHVKKYVCEICDKTYRKDSSLKTHKLTHLSESKKPTYKCPYITCDRSYISRYNLKYHVDHFHKQIHKNNKFKCTHNNCAVVLKTKRLLTLHLERHFKWTKKKERKVRHDIGKPKKSILAVLLGPEFKDSKANDVADENKDHQFKEKTDVMLTVTENTAVAVN